MTTKADLVHFLKTEPNIARLNFAFKTYKVYPSAYRKDVADAIDSGAIKLGSAPASGAGATYYVDMDRLELQPGFTIAGWMDQALLIHECTHAHLDIQNFGKHSGHENEAVAYLAEALYLEASGKPPVSTHAIRAVSHRIAKGLLASGNYAVAPTDVTDLVAQVAAEPSYSSKVFYVSDGFNRTFVRNVLRNLP
jgi:hypothetical protein